ncbi:hypothetical protein [Nocardia sp. NPDC058666]|uniref:hypothetical protein n=1 Tax=unclassified Nocardia TaxID=2637762 RepID=UPI00364D89C9
MGADHRWDVDGQCSECGCVWADCGYQQPLAGFRDTILAANGPTVLESQTGGASLVTVMRALRSARSLSLVQARIMAEELCEAGLEGTRVEMEILARRLRTSGVDVSIRSGHSKF